MKKYTEIQVYMLLGMLISCEPLEQKKRSITVVDSFDKDSTTTKSESEHENSNSTQMENNENNENNEEMYEESMELEDVTNILDTSYCDDASEEYANVPGATSYFTGMYTFSSDSVEHEGIVDQGIGAQEYWSGTEEWILIPNHTWQSIQSETCYVVWDTVAYRRDIETCLGCTFAMEVSANINVQSTTCPEDIWNYPEYVSWQVDYEVALFEDMATFFYTSGSVLGTGHANDSTFGFLTESHCVWF